MKKQLVRFGVFILRAVIEKVIAEIASRQTSESK